MGSVLRCVVPITFVVIIENRYQFNRYMSMAGEGEAAAPGTLEDTIDSDEEPAPIDTSHRNYDEVMEDTAPGAHFLACSKHVPGCKRRVQTRLGCSRVPFIEPIGSSREDFYEAKLVLGLPWYCPEKPNMVQNDEGHDVTEYIFQFDPPVNEIGGKLIESEVLRLGKSQVSFEMLCHRLEEKFCDAELDIVCRCCAEEMQDSPCPSCRYATGFHICCNDHNPCGHHLWRKGTLHAGTLDVQVSLSYTPTRHRPTLFPRNESRSPAGPLQSAPEAGSAGGVERQGSDVCGLGAHPARDGGTRGARDRVGEGRFQLH